jgi:hypothetical protein
MKSKITLSYGEEGKYEGDEGSYSFFVGQSYCSVVLNFLEDVPSTVLNEVAEYARAQGALKLVNPPVEVTYGNRSPKMWFDFDPSLSFFYRSPTQVLSITLVEMSRGHWLLDIPDGFLEREDIENDKFFIWIAISLKRMMKYRKDTIEIRYGGKVMVK